MHSTNSLISQLKADFPDLSFQDADEFRWSPEYQTIFVDKKEENGNLFILHELSHAILDHRHYSHDIDLIKLERDAWEYTQHTLSAVYSIELNAAIIQANLDTYRDWLHARSTCPSCQATGLQVRRQQYRCLACGQRWKVNEARLCALRRYMLT